MWLMNRAKDKYDRIQTKIKMDSITGGNEPREDPIMALRTQLEELQQQARQGPGNSSSGGSRNSSNNQDRRPPAWRNVPQELKNKPAPSNIANPEEVDGKKWWYCPVHGWCPHPFDEQEDILGCFYNRNNTKQRPWRRRVSNDSSNSQGSSNNQGTSTSRGDNDGERNGRAVRALAALPGRG